MKTYKQTKELNSKESSYTGTITCFYGPSQNRPGEASCFVEVKSCHSIATIHHCDKDIMLDKVQRMIDELESYKAFLLTVKKVKKPKKK